VSGPFAIYSDLSGVADLGGDEGGFATKEAALERLVEKLEGRRADTAEKLTRARRLLRKVRPRPRDPRPEGEA
jgi:hypothetical protein